MADAVAFNLQLIVQQNECTLSVLARQVYMTAGGQHFTVSEVCSDWHELIVVMHGHYAVIQTRANRLLDPRCR